ncbi:MAG TPA: hypothetical protein O0W87_00070 [Methanocorpusculum sp.]|nr:hypothetical protein [Methanocorpusculum sp.]
MWPIRPTLPQIAEKACSLVLERNPENPLVIGYKGNYSSPIFSLEIPAWRSLDHMEYKRNLYLSMRCAWMFYNTQKSMM